VSTRPIALQLFSLRDDAQKDFVGMLKSVADTGYEGVEFAGYGGLGSKELKQILDDLGLKVAGSHIGYNQLKDDLDRVIEFSLKIGCTNVVCPGAPHNMVQDAAGWRSFAGFMEEVAAKCKQHGIRTGYHNHSWEFMKINDQYGLDIFYEAADPGKVFAELDLGWVMHAGVDPVAYMRKFPGRCPLVHVKDFVGKKQTEVGTGDLDLDGIIEASDEAGVEWYIIETEEYNMEPVDSVRVGLENLKAKLA